MPTAEVREIIERERQRHLPEVFAKAERGMLNLETIGWYFDNLCHPVIYRETPEGPEVLAVGRDEVWSFEQQTSPEEHASLNTYMGY